MNKKTIQEILNDPKKIAVLIAGFLLSIFLLSLFFRKEEGDKPQITKDQIQIVKGEEIITINQDGLVEYRSKDKVYYETWDTSQINSFFSIMEQKARDYPSKKVSGGDCGYKVFMFVDGKLVTVCMDSDDEEINEYIEPIFIKYSDISLSDYFNEDDDGGNEEDDTFDGVIYFPTSTPGITRIPTPTPTTYSIYNINTNYAPVEADCETWSGDIVKNRAIISNTYCTVGATPTPTQ